MEYNKLEVILGVCNDAGVTLKQVSDKYVGLCPIHQEKTPSFWVYPSGRFVCYGCSPNGGDALDLQQTLTGQSYIEAKKALGLWDNSRPIPAKKPPEPPRQFTSDDRRECYKMARATLIRMRDCKITYQGSEYDNYQFIFKCLAGHAKILDYLNKILADIHARAPDKCDIFTELFITKAREYFNVEKIDTREDWEIEDDNLRERWVEQELAYSDKRFELIWRRDE